MLQPKTGLGLPPPPPGRTHLAKGIILTRKNVKMDHLRKLCNDVFIFLDDLRTSHYGEISAPQADLAGQPATPPSACQCACSRGSTRDAGPAQRQRRLGSVRLRVYQHTESFSRTRTRTRTYTHTHACAHTVTGLSAAYSCFPIATSATA